MICRKCGKELDPEDKFCRACGTPVGKTETKKSGDGNKEAGYMDDISSRMGRFDAKYLLMAGILVGVLAIAAFFVKMNYKNQIQNETTVIETEVETNE